MSSYACVSSSSLLVHSSSNYDELIAQAWAAHDAGAQHLLVDLSDADWASIAGLLDRHAVALIAQGAQPPDRQAG